MTETPTFLDITEAAAYIRQPVPALRTAVRHEQLRHIRRGRGGKLWFKPQWLHSWMENLEGPQPSDNTAAVTEAAVS